jgi:hypothetical protein
LRALLCILGGGIFTAAVFLHLYARLKLRPRRLEEAELDQAYWEFEDEHPAYRRYAQWLRVTFAMAAAGALLLFVSLVF